MADLLSVQSMTGHEVSLLLSIASEERPMMEHGRAVGLPKSTTSRTIRRLTRGGDKNSTRDGLGWVEIVPGSEDAREEIPILTPTGKAFVETLLRAIS